MTYKYYKTLPLKLLVASYPEAPWERRTSAKSFLSYERQYNSQYMPLRGPCACFANVNQS